MENKLLWKEENLNQFTKDDFEKFLIWSFNQKASDILIESGESLAIKVDGQVVTVGRREISYDDITEILRRIYQPASPNVLQSGNELNFQYSVMPDERRNSVLRFRINATASQGSNGAPDGLEMVLRTIPGDVPSYTALGIEKEVMDACQFKYGIILVSGPTGSGKSTTIAAMLRKIIETKPIHLITYESPIEFDLKAVRSKKARVVQSEVPANLPDYNVAIANSLRRAPDVILLGEARDKETIEGCVRASQTGHLVLTTVHTNNVAMSIARMVDEFEPSERKGATSKLVDSMRMIVHQRLVPKLGGGRIALREYLTFTESMRRHLLIQASIKNDISDDIYQLLQKNGKPLLSDAEDKFRDGKLDISQYILLINEVGSQDNLLLIPSIARDLLDTQKISSELFQSWMDEYERAIQSKEANQEVKC